MELLGQKLADLNTARRDGSGGAGTASAKFCWRKVLLGGGTTPMFKLGMDHRWTSRDRFKSG